MAGEDSEEPRHRVLSFKAAVGRVIGRFSRPRKCFCRGDGDHGRHSVSAGDISRNTRTPADRGNDRRRDRRPDGADARLGTRTTPSRDGAASGNGRHKRKTEMKEEYLWDKTGEDEEIRKLEETLAVFRHQPGEAPRLRFEFQPAPIAINKWKTFSLRFAFAFSAV